MAVLRSVNLWTGFKSAPNPATPAKPFQIAVEAACGPRGRQLRQFPQGGEGVEGRVGVSGGFLLGSKSHDKAISATNRPRRRTRDRERWACSQKWASTRRLWFIQFAKAAVQSGCSGAASHNHNKIRRGPCPMRQPTTRCCRWIAWVDRLEQAKEPGLNFQQPLRHASVRLESQAEAAASALNRSRCPLPGGALLAASLKLTHDFSLQPP